MTAVVAGLFAITVVTGIDQAETDLASEAMDRNLTMVRSAIAQGVMPALGPETRYYESGPDARVPWARWLDLLGDGFHEIDHEGGELHVFLHSEGPIRYALVSTLEQFERRERLFQRIAAGGFLVSVLAALLLGALMARRVISPVVRLSRQVQYRDQLLPFAPPLAPDYADDEVGRLAAAFDQTLGRLREAIERERMFTNDVSHELRTPLMVIASSCELLLARGLRDEGERVRLERIQHACMDMRELVETFLRLAREPSAGGESVGMSLQEIAGEQIRLWQETADARGLELQYVVEHEDCGRYPAPLLRTVLSNLLRNALHYTDSGFVLLVLRDGEFSVIDSGSGIPDGERERMFTPFTRGEAARGEGLGIGLSLVTRICERQGWSIALEGRREGGCEFRVRLSPSQTEVLPV